MITSCVIVRRSRNVSGRSHRENKINCILCSITFLREWCLLLDNVEKYGRASQATGDIIQRKKSASCLRNK
jgi:hypothetical protein